VEGETIPFVPSVGTEFDISKTISLKAQAARSYRLPTFNDLYWQPGGNPDLLAEEGWNEELTLQFHQQKETFGSTFSLTAFNRTIDNWILWQPNGLFYEPQNIAKVWSRGLEQRLQLSGNFGKINWKFTEGYDWVRSTQEEAATDAFIGKQLIYVPQHQAFAGIEFGFRQIRFHYQHTFTADVFTLSNNTKSLPAYNLGNMTMSYQLKRKQGQGRLFIRINNAWNTTYRAIENRRMPGRSMQLGCSLRFVQPSSLLVGRYGGML
jgi:iron complex outermembrane receptor protein